MSTVNENDITGEVLKGRVDKALLEKIASYIADLPTDPDKLSDDHLKTLSGYVKILNQYFREDGGEELDPSPENMLNSDLAHDTKGNTNMKHYGLDADEVEDLRAAGLSEDEIDAANEARVKAQVAGTAPVNEEGENENLYPRNEDLDPRIEIPKLHAKFPGLHPALIGFIYDAELSDEEVNEALTERRDKVESLNHILEQFCDNLSLEEVANEEITYYPFVSHIRATGAGEMPLDSDIYDVIDSCRNRIEEEIAPEERERAKRNLEAIFYSLNFLPDVFPKFFRGRDPMTY